jgi:hypothetical protein
VQPLPGISRVPAVPASPSPECSRVPVYGQVPAVLGYPGMGAHKGLEYMVCGPTGNCRLLWSPRPPRPQNPFQKVGREAPHVLEEVSRPPGPLRPPKSKIRGRPQKPCIQNPSVCVCVCVCTPGLPSNSRRTCLDAQPTPGMVSHPASPAPRNKNARARFGQRQAPQRGVWGSEPPRIGRAAPMGGGPSTSLRSHPIDGRPYRTATLP